MSMKAARGSKRVCQNCGAKFYDLNREEIVCPMCDTVFQYEDSGARAMLSGNATEDDDDDLLVAAPSNVEIVPLEEAESDDDADIPDLEGDDLVEIDDDDTELGSDEETFIEVEDDDSGDDVTGIVGGSRDEDDEV
ncbi:MAG TPA: TIGR02300 family protein [Hyphomicrobiales bacterium]|nr:TIGR02300 family protein [Hyphomicrobiales bacterium]